MKRYRLTENRLRGMIREAVKTALNEDYPFDLSQYQPFVQKIYDQVSEISELVRQAILMVSNNSSLNGPAPTYHRKYLEQAYKDLGNVKQNLQAADARFPYEKFRNTMLPQEYDG